MPRSTATLPTPRVRSKPVPPGRPGADAPGAPHPRTLILGLGNDLLTDDSIGLRIADSLQERFLDEGWVDVRKSGEAGLALLDSIAGFDALLIVDAIQTGKAAAGCFHRFEGGELKALPIRSPHFVGLAEVLALGHALGLSMPSRVRILAIEVFDPFTVGEELTPALGAALPSLVTQIEAEARGFALPVDF